MQLDAGQAFLVAVAGASAYLDPREAFLRAHLEFARAGIEAEGGEARGVDVERALGTESAVVGLGAQRRQRERKQQDLAQHGHLLDGRALAWDAACDRKV